MKSAYFKEIKHYTKQNIADKLSISLEESTLLIKRLKSLGILKVLKTKQDIDNINGFTSDDIEVSDVDVNDLTCIYLFDYVGIVVLNNYVLKCYPKYIKNKQNREIALKNILRVLRKYNASEQNIDAMSGMELNNDFNLLSIIIFILNDFIENGVYTNQKDITVINGDGEIDWDKTINETYAIISNNRPLYLDLYSRNSIDDDSDYFRKLHLGIVTECSRMLKEAELDKLFSFEHDYEFDEDISQFGDDDFILNRLSKELNVQFVSRKQLLLKTMYAFISKRKTMDEDVRFTLYGTNSFNIIWEKVCANVFNSQHDKKLNSLPINLNDRYKSNCRKTLLELIPRPLWYTNDAIAERELKKADNNSTVTFKPHASKGTLRPDIISIYKKDSRTYFGIFDAKYYAIELANKKLANNPGVEDVTKQYLYQMAYKKFIETHRLSTINAFLFPSEKADYEVLGEVEMSMFRNICGLELDNIRLIKLPANRMYYWYITDTKIKIEKEFDF